MGTNSILMVSLIFKESPQRWKKSQIWRVHTGHSERPFREFGTKREGTEFVAHMGRECTRLLREVNELYRRAVQEGQGLCPAMTAPQIIRWNEIKQSFDASLAFIAVRTGIIMPNAMIRLLGMSRDVQAMAKMVGAMSKVRFTGTQTALQCCGRDALAIETQLTDLWAGTVKEIIVAIEPERRMYA